MNSSTLSARHGTSLTSPSGKSEASESTFSTPRSCVGASCPSFVVLFLTVRAGSRLIEDFDWRRSGRCRRRIASIGLRRATSSTRRFRSRDGMRRRGSSRRYVRWLWREILVAHPKVRRATKTRTYWTAASCESLLSPSRRPMLTLRRLAASCLSRASLRPSSRRL